MSILNENCLRNMNSSEILQLEFLCCDGKENISEEPNIIGANEKTCVNQLSPQQKTELITKMIEGNFKKKDTENIKRIKSIAQILIKYDPGQVNFQVQFNLILKAFKKLKSSSSKLAVFLYVLDSTKDKKKEESIAKMNNEKLYQGLSRKCKKLINQSNPKFSLDIHSIESFERIKTHLQKKRILN